MNEIDKIYVVGMHGLVAAAALILMALTFVRIVGLYWLRIRRSLRAERSKTTD